MLHADRSMCKNFDWMFSVGQPENQSDEWTDNVGPTWIHSKC